MRLLITFARIYPLQSAAMLIALLLAGLAEGIGLSALIPLLSIAVGDRSGSAEPSSGLEKMVTETLSTLGLDPTIGVLLVVIVCSVLFQR